MSSASSRLRSGVADFGNCWEASGHKEVSHEQEGRWAAVGGRAECLSGDHQDSQGTVAEISSCAESFALALDGKKRQEPPTPCKLDGEAEAKLIAMRLGKPPAGYGHWTLQLLADELVTLEVVDSISHETVRKTLKKTA